MPLTQKGVEERASLFGKIRASASKIMGRYEHPDPTPMAPPVGFKRRPSLADQIREMVRNERLQRELDQAGYETFEEADDFDVGDDFDPTSAYEEHFDGQFEQQAQAALTAKEEKPVDKRTTSQKALDADREKRLAALEKQLAEKLKSVQEDD